MPGPGLPRELASICCRLHIHTLRILLEFEASCEDQPERHGRRTKSNGTNRTHGHATPKNAARAVNEERFRDPNPPIQIWPVTAHAKGFRHAIQRTIKT